ncbi:hypothetical protein HNP25_003427 [Arcicella rosea]|uniref:Uncharacterized protein n=1 Tax=Arcicella rosea TaxID=502909 RepID=A0A841EKR1_9BACT|nr:hypothetical protein [Arcicella rosea]
MQKLLVLLLFCIVFVESAQAQIDKKPFKKPKACCNCC